MIMKVIITGANGQLGSCIRDLAVEHPEIEFLYSDVDELDITDYEAVEEVVLDFKPDVIVNCASYNAVDQAEDNPLEALKINGKAVQGIAGIARKHDIGLIHISTDYIFDGLKGSAYSELDEPHPQSKYAHSKFIGEQAVQTAGPSAAIIRTSWLYSEYGHNFVKTMVKLTNEKDELGIVFDQVGGPTYATDLAQAIKQIIPQYQSEHKGIYHFSNLGVASWYDLTKSIQAINNTKCNIKPIESYEYPTKAKRPHYSVLNTKKIRDTFSLSIPYWKESLELCLQKLS